MKTIAYKAFGNTSVLQTTEESIPSIQPDQVLIKVSAVSINPLDWKIRKGEMKLMSGSRFPKHTGTDFSGIIEETGSSVSGFKKGDEVFGVVKNNMKEGALAEYVAVPASLIWKKPAQITLNQAAAIPTAGAAAVTALGKMGNIDSSTRVLVNGAAGGFGMFLLQLLKAKGANVTAVTSTAGTEYAQEWGADAVIDYRNENPLTLGARYDIVIDLSGKLGYQNAKQLLNARGIYLDPVPRPIDIITTPIKNLFRSRKHITLITAPSQENIGTLLQAVENGLQIHVSKVFSFSQTQAAYAYAEKGGYIGKIAIDLTTQKA
ncbi:NAD(P)-dependent alcohol dehydrogenase [Pedobacter sp. JY14-1]|uniref:NAD(P)-dependent alcohol dehydrogenase n=1 Tax=Pedobacter sp. JY14-1 TaxID=3034151 RepID=UPI0023E3279A|nr:NAD(P)-dependent alcohol dehydrogenase [Pedobacter sp. JY14-1]